MSASPAQILKKFLEDNEDSDSDWMFTISSMPDKPVKRITVYDRPAVKDGRLMSGTVIEHPGAMVIIRAETYVQGWAKAKEIEALFDGALRETVTLGTETVEIQCISRDAGVNALGADPTANTLRELFSLNVSLTINR
jgi:hypothetical protein